VQQRARVAARGVVGRPPQGVKKGEIPRAIDDCASITEREEEEEDGKEDRNERGKGKTGKDEKHCNEIGGENEETDETWDPKSDFPMTQEDGASDASQNGAIRTAKTRVFPIRKPGKEGSVWFLRVIIHRPPQFSMVSSR
jgi:hypothetical protein